MASVDVTVLGTRTVSQHQINFCTIFFVSSYKSVAKNQMSKRLSIFIVHNILEPYPLQQWLQE
jgi:hypothetical protein